MAINNLSDVVNWPSQFNFIWILLILDTLTLSKLLPSTWFESTFLSNWPNAILIITLAELCIVVEEVVILELTLNHSVVVVKRRSKTIHSRKISIDVVSEWMTIKMTSAEKFSFHFFHHSEWVSES